MSKKINKSTKAIKYALTILLSQKNYEDISVQDILDTGNIARSTFYSHYKTKDDLLLSISNEIFDHVFSHTLTEEETHDFSNQQMFSYKNLITHIFYHILDERELFSGIISSKENKTFLDQFKKHLYALIDSYYSNYPYTGEIPLVLQKDIIVQDFITILTYWVNGNYQETPEQITEYFIKSFLKTLK